MQSGRQILEFWMNLLPLPSFTLKMEVASFFSTLLHLYKTTQHHIQDCVTLVFTVMRISNFITQPWRGV